jgi:NADPH2:quinone reductase
MRAVAVRKTGDAPELMELPQPRPGQGEVLVKLAAAAVNPMDWKIAEGALVGQLPHASPIILGSDGAGRVEAVGEGASRFSVGETVYGQFFLVPVGSGGAFAEYVAVPEESATSVILPAPDGISVTDAAAVPTAAMTALGVLEASGLRAGQAIVIIGATGGIGCFATQFAARLGAHVIATARPDARELITGLGAAETTGYTPDEIVERARSSRPEGVDVLLDLVGDRDVFDACTGVVREGGTALSVYFGAPAEPPADSKIHMSNYILMDNKVDLLRRISEEISTGRVRVPVRDQVPLDDAVGAIARNKNGGARGKTVVQISI